MSWMRFSAWYLVSDLWVVFIALSLFVAWWEGHLGFKNLLRSCLFGDATQLGISVEMGHVSSQLNFTASLLALRLYSRWPLYVLMYASICLQGIYVSKPIYNCIIHLHEFVCSGVWCVVNYCRGFSWCYLAGKYRMNGWTIALDFLLQDGTKVVNSHLHHLTIHLCQTTVFWALLYSSIVLELISDHANALVPNSWFSPPPLVT